MQLKRQVVNIISSIMNTVTENTCKEHNINISLEKAKKGKIIFLCVVFKNKLCIHICHLIILRVKGLLSLKNNLICKYYGDLITNILWRYIT